MFSVEHNTFNTHRGNKMAKYQVKSYVSIMLEIEADSPQDADYAAGQMIHTYLQQWDYDYVEDATIYDEDGEEVETA